MKRAQGGAAKPGGIKVKVGLVFLVCIFVWASVPGRSPSRVEEFLLAPFAFLAGLPALCQSSVSDPLPLNTVKSSWLMLRRLEVEVTSLAGEHQAIFADVLARRGRGGGGLKDKLLLALSPDRSLSHKRVPCLVKNVLIGFLDQVHQPQHSRFDRILFSLGLKEKIDLPDLAWVRLLHARQTPWVEPLRLPVIVEDGERSYSAILAPAKEEFLYPLRLSHPASLERPKVGAKVYTERNNPPLAVFPGRLIGRVVHDPSYPELNFIEPEYRPDSIHCVHVFHQESINSPRLREDGPLKRGRLIPALISPLPTGGLRGGGLLLMAGSVRGVRQGSAVVAGWSLIGKVHSVGPFHCRVFCPGDPGFRLQVVAVKNKGRSLARGRISAVADGTGRSQWTPATGCKVNLEIGDLLWTAPEILDLPKGLFVGKVTQAPDAMGRFTLGRLQKVIPPRLGVFKFGPEGKK